MRDRKIKKGDEITFEKLLDTYEGVAATERVKMGKPSTKRISSAKNAVVCVLRELNIKLDAKITVMTRKRFDEYAIKAIRRGVSPVSIRTYFNSFEGLTAKWTRSYYKDRKMQVKRFDVPKVFVEPKRYQRPSEETTQKVLSWYKSLERGKDLLQWGAVAMMLEFAMRTGDVERLTWENFKQRKGEVFLEYTPHKTARSSGRRVVCRVVPKIWRRFVKLRKPEDTDGKRIFDIPDIRKNLFGDKINKAMMSFGFTGSKRGYELRKLCVDNVYRNFGAEAASAISGDDIRTVLRYYADPSIVDLGGECITDIMGRKCEGVR